MAIQYARVNWNSTTTFLNPTNLNTMDAGIKAVCDEVNSLNNNLSFTVNSFVTGFTQNVTCLKSLKTQYVNGIVEHPTVVDAGTYLTIGWVPESPLYGWFFTGLYVSGSNSYPALYKLGLDKTLEIFISSELHGLTSGASYINFAYPIA